MSYTQTAASATLKHRADMLARIRAFFAVRGVLEVDTPALSAHGICDPAIDAIRASAPGFGRTSLYLHTSPELAMKRLLAAGAGDIYTLCRVFRDGEAGRWHEPEFTMLEWYRVGWGELALADEVVDLLGRLLAQHGPAPAAERLTYRVAIERALGVNPEAPAEDLAAALRGVGVAPPESLDRDALLDLALSTVVAPGFEPGTLTVVHDFPASQAALAEIKRGDPPVAARFEVFFGGVELANGYRELTDPAEQRSRFEADLERRRRAGRPAPPIDEAFLDALAHLPASAGVSVGVDRTLALALGFDGLAPALPFTHERP